MALYSYNTFVRATDLECTPTDSKSKKHVTQVKPTVEGTDVRGFYESLVGLSDVDASQSVKGSGQPPVPGPSNLTQEGKHCKLSKTSKSKSSNKPKSTTSVSQTLYVKDFLQAAQDGDLKKVKDCLQTGLDINAQDQYGWTALMCATQEGQVDVVKYLLWQECNMFICDSKGVSALDLAKKKRNRELVALLVDHINGKTYKEKTLQHKKTSAKYPRFYCDICKKYFEDCSQKSHETSTIHLFNQKLPTKPSGYLIPETNKGFQMLLKSGWEQDKGLGTEGQGHKFPVKTVLKRDRKGLGLEEKDRSKARITHFQPHDKSAVKSVRNPSIRKEKASTRSKKAIKKKLSTEREFEKNYRMEFHMSVDY